MSTLRKYKDFAIAWTTRMDITIGKNIGEIIETNDEKKCPILSIYKRIWREVEREKGKKR